MKCANPPLPSANKTFARNFPIYGQETALRLARIGRIISAIKWIESMNPTFTRQHAKTIVNSFGYSSEPRWPQDDNQPARCL